MAGVGRDASPSAPCPAPDVVARFASGQLSADDPVGSHVADCPRCLESVRRLADGSARGLDETLAARSAAVGRDVEPGRTIGSYILIRRLGAGGMGEVWEADQQVPVRRRVALKLIKAGMGSRELVARFESERQALAIMQHPGIAQLFDAGTAPDGRPYFAMELVDGSPITRHCDEERLDVPARLRLFQRVCAAVQHAHFKGVIHRDLKPSNVLVTAGAPKVIDFGLAKATEGHLGDETQTGALLGTPAYASPEQMHLSDVGVDTRSDVYSLSMLLYEMLVGALPFDLSGAPLTVLEIRQRIWEDELPRPSARLAALPDRDRAAANRRTDAAGLRRALAGDLDWIVLRGLERELDRRYGSADELSADIDRHLRDEPVTAGPPGAAYRARKFVRRHRVMVAVAGGLLTLAVAFALTMAVQARRIAGERDRAEAEAAKAAAVTAFLQETIGAADPWQNGGDVSVRETLGRAAARVDASFRGQPLVGAAVRRAIGNTFTELGRYGDARPLLEAALATRTQLLGPTHADVAESHADLAVLFERNGGLDDAVAHDRAALAIRRSHPDARRLVGDTLNHLATTLYFRGEYDEAARAGEESLAIREEVLGPNSAEVSDTLNTLAAVAGSGHGDNEKSEALSMRSLEIRRAISGPDDARTADAINQLAVVRNDQGRFADAEALYRDVVRIYRDTLGPEHPFMAVAMENLGSALVRQKRYDEALVLLRDVLAIRRAKLGEASPVVTRTLVNRAITESSAGHLEAAEAGFLEALPRMRKNLGEDHPDVAATIAHFARLREKQGRDDSAEELYRQALAIRVRKLPPTHAAVAATRLSLSKLLAKRGQLAEAEPLMVEAHAAFEKSLGKDAPQTREAAEALEALASQRRTGGP